MSIVPEVQRQLREAALRRTQNPLARGLGRARRWRGSLLSRPLIAALVAASGATGVAVAGSALVRGGSPAPAEYPNLGARILPADTRLLTLRVPDPAGGPPWGMRLIYTSADRNDPTRNAGRVRWGCVQVGRVVDGRLGVLGQDGAFHDDGLFHELPVQPEGCGAVNDHGRLIRLSGVSNIEAASGYQGLAGCVTESTRRRQSIALPSLRRELAVARAEHDPAGIRAAREGLASYRHIAPAVAAEPLCRATDLRHIVFGVAGPRARSVTVTGQGLNVTVPVSPRDDGAYLIVQREGELQKVLSTLKSENLALMALALHTTVHYENDRSCHAGSSPSCLAPLGSLQTDSHHSPALRVKPSRSAPRPPAPATALSRRAERDPATPNPVTVAPAAGAPHTAFKLSFRALLGGGGYSYAIRAPKSIGCQREAERATGGSGVALGGIPIERGDTVTKTLRARGRRGLCPGAYTVYVAYFDPERDTLENFPFAAVRFSVVAPARQ